MRVVACVVLSGVLMGGILSGQEPAKEQPSQGAALTYQETVEAPRPPPPGPLRPQLKPSVTYSGPVTDLLNGQNPLRPRPDTNVVYRFREDLSVDLITRRPRGIVLFAVNF